MIKIYKFEVITKLLVIFLLYYIVYFIKNNFKSSKLYRYFYREKNKKLFLKKILETNEESKNLEDHLYKLEIFDIFSNKEFSKLIKSINKLDKNKFKVKSYYRNKVIGDYDYVDAFNGVGGWSRIAEITPKNEKHISKISIGKTQLNNKEVFVEFTLALEKKELANFIRKNAIFLDSRDIGFFDFSKDDSMLKREISKCYFNLYQYYLRTILKLAYGKGYILPKVVYIYEKNLDLKKYEKLHFSESYILKEDECLLLQNFVEDDYTLYNITNKSVIDVNMFNYLNNELYYKLFSEIEKREFRTRINKYFSETQKYIKYKDYLWLINKNRNLESSDEERKKENDHIKDKELRDFIVGKGLQKSFFKKKYKNSYKYLSTIYSQQKEIFIIVVTTITLLVTLIGIGVTIYLSLTKKS